MKKKLAKLSKEPKPCVDGKIRNPKTGRCVNVKKSPSIKPCKEGKVRNPITKRCVNIKKTK